MLASHFGSLPLRGADGRPCERKLVEYPYQLRMAHMAEESARSLCDLEFLEAKMEAGLVAGLADDLRQAAMRFGPDQYEVYIRFISTITHLVEDDKTTVLQVLIVGWVVLVK